MGARKRRSDRSGRAALPSPGRPPVAGRDERSRFWVAIASGVRMGWYREAKVKSMESRQVRATLAARAKLVDIRRDIENQMRGLLKSLGIVLGKAGGRTLPSKIVATLRQAPHLQPLIEPLLLAHSALITQILKYDGQIRDLARSDQTVRRLMTVPGVSPVTALAFASTVDDPKRFKRASGHGVLLILVSAPDQLIAGGTGARPDHPINRLLRSPKISTLAV